MWARLQKDIFQAEYDGMYCVGCEEGKSEDDVIVDGDRKLCKIHLTPVENVKEKNYFFRLSAYADKLLAWYETNPVRPESRLNEVRSFVRGGLRDLSISRAIKWGIPVPGDPSQTVYVWIDALTNYLTVLGGPEAAASGEGKGAFWPAAHHLIAKDILRFHAVYWPALLMSAGLPLPKQIFCHGYLTVKGQKISKSMPATRVDPLAIAGEMGVDPLRYFVLREYTFGGDGDFTYEALFQRYQSDLGNDLGNLLNRTLSMVHKYLGDTLAGARGRNPGAHELLQPAQDELGQLQPVGRAGSDLAIDSRVQPEDRRREAVGAAQERTDRPPDGRAGRLLRSAALGGAAGRAGDTFRLARNPPAARTSAGRRDLAASVGLARRHDHGTDAGVPAHRTRSSDGADREVDTGAGAAASAPAAPTPPGLAATAPAGRTARRGRHRRLREDRSARGKGAERRARSESRQAAEADAGHRHG